MGGFKLELMDKLDRLKERLGEYESMAIAFSGGVDSTFLLNIASSSVENIVAITIKSDLCTEDEFKESVEYAKKLGVKHVILEVDETKIDGFRENPSDRCYICKKEIFTNVIRVAKENGIERVCDGSNYDDISDYRPGMKALEELGIESPLKDMEFTKDEIRILSKLLKIPTWNKPSAACLASRIPYGEEINKEKLKMVELGEKYLKELGFRIVRVRLHKDMLARIEIGADEMEKILDQKVMESVNNEFKRIGFKYVTLDFKGYRVGSLNESIIK